MSEQNIINKESRADRSGGLVGGIILIGIGLGLLFFRLFNLYEIFPLVLGVIFLVVGMATRKAGFLIPGGILSGVGLGVLSTVNGWFAPMGSTYSGGIFLLSFALGWFLITLTSMIFTHERLYWPIIPGSIMAVIGGLMLAGTSGLTVLEYLGIYWPLILVIIGLSTLVGWWKNRP